MAGTVAARIAALDTMLSGVTHVEWSENGTSVSANVAATAVTMEAALDIGAYVRKGIDVASPPQLSAAAAGACTITHFRFTTAASGGTAKTTWIPLTAAATLVAGGKLSLADAGLFEKLTAA